MFWKKRKSFVRNNLEIIGFEVEQELKIRHITFT